MVTEAVTKKAITLWSNTVNELTASSFKFVRKAFHSFIHSFITSIYIAPLQVGLLRGAPNPNTTK